MANKQMTEQSMQSVCFGRRTERPRSLSPAAAKMIPSSTEGFALAG